MDYSLLLGLHDCARAEQENRERAEREEDEDNHDDEEDSESGSGLDTRVGEWVANFKLLCTFECFLVSAGWINLNCFLMEMALTGEFGAGAESVEWQRRRNPLTLLLLATRAFNTTTQ